MKASTLGTHLRLPANERAAAGRAARADVSRSDLAEYTPPRRRKDPVAILEEQNALRQASLLPIRHGRMSASPFAFLRGAAAVMAADLAKSPVSGLRVQAIGDAHLSNFGVFATPERRLTFDVNDFDETLPAPWEWDIKRLAASVVVAAEENGADRRAATDAARRTAQAYRESMHRLAANSTLDVWYAHLDVEDLAQTRASRKTREQEAKALRKIRTKTSSHVVGKLAVTVDGRLRFRSLPPLVTPLAELLDREEADRVADEILRGFAAYRESLAPERRLLLDRFRMVDMARKVVGVGSVGTRCFIVLLIGRDNDDVLVLQFKEAGPSVLEKHAGASEYTHQGERVVQGQRLIQVASDIFLGWNSFSGEDKRHYYWRQLKDMKASAEIGVLNAKTFQRYLDACAWCLAHAHARSGDPIAIAAYLGSGTSFDKAMGAFAGAYADQTREDWQALRAAIESGRLEATPGV